MNDRVKNFSAEFIRTDEYSHGNGDERTEQKATEDAQQRTSQLQSDAFIIRTIVIERIFDQLIEHLEGRPRCGQTSFGERTDYRPENDQERKPYETIEDIHTC